MEKIITFSIAAYNVQNTLRNCLDSFIDNSNMYQIEVIIVDDGSKDSTKEISQEYCNKYPETFKLFSKENGGHGSTINTAVKIANGKYFRPIDGDDCIRTENLAEIISLLQKIENDAVVCDFDIFYLSDGKTEKRNYTFLKPFDSHAFSEFDKWKTTFPFHSIFFKTSILQNNNVTLTEKCFYEDSEYTLYPLEYCKDFFYIPKTLYVYSIGSASQSVAFNNLLKHIDNQEQVIRNLFVFYTREEHSNKQNYIRQRIFEVLNFYYKMTLDSRWYKNKILQQRKRVFTAELKKINKNLLSIYINQTVLQKVLYRTNYRFDGFVIKLYKKMKNRRWR